MNPSFLAELLAEASGRIIAREPLILSGLRGGGRALLIAALAREAAAPLVVLCESFSRAEALHHDLQLFAGEDRVYHFPNWDTIPYDTFSPNKEIVAQRFLAFAALIEDRCPILVTTPQAMMQGMIPRQIFEAATFSLATGQRYSRAELLHNLLQAGYVRVDLTEGPGEFSARGEIVDIFPIHCEHPVRLDFFDDDLETMRLFDVGTQKSFEATGEITVYPAGECVINETSAKEALAVLPHYKSQVQPEAYRQLYGYLEQATPFPGAEQLLGLFHDPVGWLHQALPENTVLLMDEPDKLTQRAQDFHGEVLGEFEISLEQGNLALPPETIFLSPESLARELGRFYAPQLVELRVEGGANLLTCPFSDNQTLRSAMATGGGSAHATLAKLIEQLKQWRDGGSPVLLAARSGTGAERLHRLLEEFEVGSRLELFSPDYFARAAGVEVVIQPAGAAADDFIILDRSPRQGFRIVDDDGATRFALITEEELLGEKTRQRRLKKSNLQHFIASLGDLKEGDLVVHLEYGIGRYEGLRKLNAGQEEGDFLVLRYAGGDKVYVPVYRLNQVQKFTGVDGGAPSLNKLGDGNWQKSKNKASRVIEDMAEDLVSVQAARRSRTGFGFDPNEAMLTEFEEAFSFQETDDQHQAIAEVLGDMIHDMPMDRLVCGDVGFGKTEVAMRAAYLAALSGKQIMVLVPTTILAQQHFETFSQRFEEFAVRVDVLSRFRTPQEQKEVVKEFAEGGIDILIGTHRLLSKDVQPKALGLLVIDEEQRFGVTHKEKIKRLRTQVDVVTLSATPIPRTLHMALMGVRDLSIINTPPMDRMAIRTRLVKGTDYIIREAVERELRRGGQVFYVHNRVDKIHAYGTYLQGILPQARLGIAHGQMAEKKLEEVMLRFVRGELDMLLTTTIIESGLDIPRANTIIIHNADQFGLSQLYQLRGRVGRSNRQAYAYMLVSPEKVLTELAQKRLTLLREFNDLGSGFKIASYDLEIRGAGDLLGRSQSGHVNSVGLELYTQMVEEAVAKLQGEEAVQAKLPECTIDLGYAYMLPESFIQSTPQRLDAYKRLAEIRNEEDMWSYRQALEDRFGRIPTEVQNLFTLIQVRLRAERYGITALERAGGQLQARIGHPERIDLEALMALLQNPEQPIRLVPEDRLVLGKVPEYPEQVLERLKVLEGVIAQTPETAPAALAAPGTTAPAGPEQAKTA